MPYHRAFAFCDPIAMIKPGSSVALEVTRRDGKTSSVRAKLGELPDETRAQAPQRRQPRQQRNRIFVSP